MLTADRIIELLGLEPLPVEGGYFRRTYLASESIGRAALPPRYQTDKPYGSAIYYLLHGGELSALHRLPTDEVYHFYLGDPVEMLLLHPDGTSETVVLGQDLKAGQQVQAVVPRGVWQGARLRPGGTFALLGTTMAPAWGPEDFELGDVDELCRVYPVRADEIRRLTWLSQ
jgi:predicted cupin superfamily sugar epimerase